MHQKPNPNPTPVKTGDGVSVSSIDIPANAAPATPQPTALKKRNLVGLGVASESSPNDLSQCGSNRDRSQGASFVPRNRSIDGHHGRYDDNRRAHNGDRGSNRGGHVKRQDRDRGWSLPPHTNMLQPMHRGYFRPSMQAPRPVQAPIPAWPPFLSTEAHSRPLVVPVGLLGK